jgi:hypothetical protein
MVVVLCLSLSACSSGGGSNEAPLPAASSIPQAPTGVVGVEHTPPSWDPAFRAPPAPVPTTPQPGIQPEDPFGHPPQVDGGAGGGTQL